ncbi:hypothetical protein ACHAWF_007307 [Thalassiosira exigua]
MKSSPALLAAGASATAAAAALSLVVLPAASTAFVVLRPSVASSSRSLPSTSPPALRLRSSLQEDLTFVPPDVSGEGGIVEELCADAARRMKRVMVPVSEDVSDTGYVGVSYVRWEADPAAKRKLARESGEVLPLLLVHGFDSSALEYRRLGPRLAALGVDVIAVDLLGWGYTQLDSVKDFSAEAKVDALNGFWEVVGGNSEVVVGGASLGGAAAIEFAARNLRRDESDEEGVAGGYVRGTVLIDAQGFVDGIGPMSFLPAPLARAGIQVLRSEPLRSSANQMSYYDKEAFATDDALKVGRLHTLREGWEEGMMSFMKSGGFRPKKKVSQIDVPTLVLWGRQDGILDGEEFAYKFQETMPDARLEWIEECGHVPHLEQAERTAGRIAEFLGDEGVRPSRGRAGSREASFGGVFDGILSFLN